MNKIQKVLLLLLISISKIIKNDELYLKLLYRLKMNKKLNLLEPKTFNEKINWLKIHDRKDLYTTMVDKSLVKEYVSKKIGNEYVIKTLGIYSSFSEIDFSKLPNQFVMKCTHDSGGLIICKDKNTLNIKKAKRKINKCLKTNYYLKHREWPYKNVHPRILIEEYMEDKKTKELRDYKFFCFDGEPKFMFVATDRGIGKTKFNFYDIDFNKLPVKQHYPNDDRIIERPLCLNEMIILAKKLSNNIPQVRIDFYEINGKVYFGEYTFSHFAGLMPFEPEEWDNIFGKMIDISSLKKYERIKK